MIICITAIGGIFGAIHCLAWNAHFPTHFESKLWRAAAIIVTALPGMPLLGGAVDAALGKWANEDWKETCGILLGSGISLVYVFARICLLVLALCSLRALPYNAYVIPSWTIYIPHI